MKKKYLITGASGFLGRHITGLISQSDYDSVGRSTSNTINLDLSNFPKGFIFQNDYDYLVHCAGVAHISNIKKSDETYILDVNYLGLKSLMHSINLRKLKGIVFISSASVYGEFSHEKFCENSKLIGKNIYSKCKILAETYLTELSITYDIPLLILRLPLLVGDAPPGNLNSMIKAIKSGYYFNIAGGSARRSMVLASDVASFVISHCGISGVYNLTDGFDPSYREISLAISKSLNKKPPFSIPYWIAWFLANVLRLIMPIPIDRIRLSKLVNNFVIDDSSARNQLNWNPGLVLESIKKLQL